MYHQLLNKKNTKLNRRKYWVVSFLKERSYSLNSKLQELNRITKSSRSSPTRKKEASKNLKNTLWFDQMAYRRYLIKLQKFVYLTLDVDISKHISWVIRSYEEAACDIGPVGAVKRFKFLHDCYIRIISSNSIPKDPFISTNSRGEPKLLGPLLELGKGTLNERRAGLHAIQVIKLVCVWDNSFSTDTIEKHPPVEMIPFDEQPKLGGYLKRAVQNLQNKSSSIDYNRLIRSYIEVLRETFPSEERDKRRREIAKLSDIHYSARNGPNGPSLTTVVLDHHRLSIEEKELYKAIYDIAIASGNGSLLTFMTKFDEEPYLWENIKKERPIDSRLSIKDESWAKRRIFAICDWFSQSSLKGLHTYLFRWLAAQPEDGTFNQNKIAEMVKKWTTGSGEPESADLSAATDSIPVEVQTEILAQIVSPKFAMLWRRICCDRRFKSPNTTSTLTYNTGQPMGILSSWAMLAVWHHIMCRTCLKYLGVLSTPESPRYGVVGDDVTLNGSDEFTIYNELVSVIQGVGISKVKGFHKETQNQGNRLPHLNEDQSMVTAEFTKRIFCSGYELTVIPPDELLSAFGDPTQFPDLFSSLLNRGYPELTLDKLPSLTSLCRHKKLALLLVTNPLTVQPQFKGSLHHLSELGPLSNLPWYKPEFNEDLFKETFIKTLKGQLIAVLSRVLGRLNQWITYSVNCQETKVKAWRYESDTQSFLIRTTATKLAGKVAESDMKCEKVFKNRDPNSWKLVKEFLSELQIIFEIDLLFKEENIPKRSDKYYFANLLLGKVLRETVKVEQERMAQFPKP